MTSLRSLLLSALVVFFFVSSLSSSSAETEKVSLVLYYETLCPFCSLLIVNGFVKLFQKDLIDMVDLKLVPYGNARVDGNSNVVCQHGEYECLLNTVEACAIHVWPDLNKHFPYIYCVEDLIKDGKHREWESCFGKLSLDPTPIEECYQGQLGKKLILQYANETNNLQPPHTYVPWVTVNDQPLLEDYANFITYICKAYKGISLPKACIESSLRITPKAKENQIPQVTYAEGGTSPTKMRTQVYPYRRQMMATSI